MASVEVQNQLGEWNGLGAARLVLTPKMTTFKSIKPSVPSKPLYKNIKTPFIKKAYKSIKFGNKPLTPLVSTTTSTPAEPVPLEPTPLAPEPAQAAPTTIVQSSTALPGSDSGGGGGGGSSEQAAESMSTGMKIGLVVAALVGVYLITKKNK